MTFFIWANCFTSCDTAWTEVPDPWAIRRLREPSMICGLARQLFPQGNYRFHAKTIGNQLSRSTDALTAELPCPVKVVSPPKDEPVAPDRVVIRWEPAPGVFNPDSGICKKNQDVELASYEVIAEVVNEEAGLVRHYTVELAAGVTELPVPRTFFKEGLLLPGTEFRLEVIAIEDTGNKLVAAVKGEPPGRVAA